MGRTTNHNMHISYVTIALWLEIDSCRVEKYADHDISHVYWVYISSLIRQVERAPERIAK
jgi:hypothetical protein